MSDTEFARLFDRVSDTCSVTDMASSPDLDRYRPYVAHLDMPEERETELILAVRWMMQGFVDRAFGDDPVQRSGYVAGNRHAVDEAAALPMIDCLNDAHVDKTLFDSFNEHAVRAKNQEKR